LGFDIEENLLTFIKQNKDLINTLSYSRIKEELDYIIASKNRVEGLKYLKELKLEDVLEISIPDEVDDSEDPLCIWSQLDFSNDYPFTKNELNNISDIKSVVSYGIIDNIILYRYGLYICQLAGDILNISDSYISELYKELPIYSSKDIDISGDEIIELLGIEPSGIIKDIYRDLETVILNNKINNNKEDIKKYILDNWR
jgi:tRNA nucleotidyltransferase/poly(A) polymerase